MALGSQPENGNNADLHADARKIKTPAPTKTGDETSFASPSEPCSKIA